MNRKAFVLLSGGMDSTTCLFQAIYDYCPQDMVHAYADKAILAEHIGSLMDGTRSAIEHPIDWVEAISVDYGQRHLKETEYAKATCALLGIKHSVLNVRGILNGDGVMLTDASVVVPDINYDEIKGVSPTYVPFRNGTLLSLITAHAQKWVNSEIKRLMVESEDGHGDLSNQEATNKMRDSVGIYFGAHSEDAHNWAYPDCTPEFIGSMANAIYTGSYYSIRLHTPIMWSSKADVVRLGERLDVPWDKTWSCYKGLELQCGTCPTCQSRRGAFEAAGIVDPTEYAEQVFKS